MENVFMKLIEKYGMTEVEPHGNERRAFVAVVGDAQVRLSHFGCFLSLSIALGEVRHCWENHTPLGEFGMFGASCEIRDQHSLGGHGLPGGDLVGLVWRIGAVAPQSRTVVPEVGDKFVQVDDIVEYLLGLSDVVRNALPSARDLAIDAWENAEPGW